MNQTIIKKEVLLFLGLILTTFLTAQNLTKLEQQIDGHFTELDQPDTPGGAIIIIKDGATFFQKAYGTANLETSTPNDLKTKFPVGDIANQFIAYSILLLAQEQKLNLNDDIRKYLPELPAYNNKINILNLLTHTHGLFDYMNLHFISGRDIEQVRDTKTAINLLKPHATLLNAPGTTFQYNSTGFVLAAEIITRVSGQSFIEFANKYIFTPLGMDRSQFCSSREDIQQNVAHTYYKSNENFKHDRLNYHYVASSNLLMSIEDLGKWMLHVQSLEGTLAKFNTVIKFKDISFDELGIGQFMEDFFGIEKYAQNGLAYGNMTYMARFPSHQFGIAVLSNNSNFYASNAADNIAEALLSDVLKKIDSPENSQTITSSSNINPATVENICGQYLNKDYYAIRKIELRNDSLFYVRRAGSESALHQIEENVFEVIDDPEVHLTFKIEDGIQQVKITVNEDYEYLYKRYESLPIEKINTAPLLGVYYSPATEASYHINMAENKLVFSNMGQPASELNPIGEKTFLTDVWSSREIEFITDENESIIGLQVSSSNVKKVFFEKIN